ncbi:MAG: Pycsar system effector family protein [Pseudomonadota bacterium]
MPEANAKELPRKIESLKFALERNIGWTNAADTKAGFLVGFCGLFAQSVASQYALSSGHKSAVQVVALVLFALGVVLATLAIAPRIKPTFRRSRPSAMFFSGVVERFRSHQNLVELTAAELLDRSELEVAEDLSEQLIAVSLIAERKYRFVQGAALLGLLGMVALLWSYFL